MNNRSGIRIAVIDSGIHNDGWLPHEMIEGIAIKDSDGDSIEVSDNYDDTIGHGTAVVDCLLKNTTSISSVFCVKIYNESNISADPNVLIKALEYIDKHVNCNMVLISSGIVCTDKRDAIQRIINKIYNKGIIIIAAFDNNGAMSYPASFQSVIGVATNAMTGEMPRIANSSRVDIVVPERAYRLRWVNPAKIIIGGSSFAAPVVAAKVAELMVEDNILSSFSNDVIIPKLAHKLNLAYHPEKAIRPSWEQGEEFVGTMKKAVVFPWNKETNAIARYNDLLSFNILGYYDVKYSMHVGKKVYQLLDLDSTTFDPTQMIKNIDDLDWNADFDTLICGHCAELSAAMHRNLFDELTEKCRRYKKSIYAFDKEFGNYTDRCRIFIPEVNNHDVPYSHGGRLYDRFPPLIGVFGTSSKQGKFSVQLELRKRFLAAGYNISQVTSEPSGYLFGADAVFPFGYNANTEVAVDQTTQLVNCMIESVVNDDTEVVIIGNQSGTIPYSYNNISQMNFYSQGLIYGANPDVYILCVNPHDPIDYIKSTVEYLHSLNNATVCSLVLFPFISEASTQLGYGFTQRKLSANEINVKSEILEREIGKPVYILGDTCDMDDLYNHVVNELSKENE